jgi:hypothetical protein
MLSDEDFAHHLKLYLMEKSNPPPESDESPYISGQTVVDFVNLPETQEYIQKHYPGSKATISPRTGQRWLQRLDWRFGKKKHGMYIDGHERQDVVAYRKAFCERWKEYEKRMFKFDNDGNVSFTPTGFRVPQWPRFRLVLVTHDESTFRLRDYRKSMWNHASEQPEPERKGEGPTIMVSDFLTSEWGRLICGEDEDE